MVVSSNMSYTGRQDICPGRYTNTTTDWLLHRKNSSQDSESVSFRRWRTREGRRQSAKRRERIENLNTRTIPRQGQDYQKNITLQNADPGQETSSTHSPFLPSTLLPFALLTFIAIRIREETEAIDCAIVALRLLLVSSSISFAIYSMSLRRAVSRDG